MYWYVLGVVTADDEHDVKETLPQMWSLQKSMADLLQNEKNLIILKARQVGWTTLVSAYAAWTILFQPSRFVLVLSKKEKPDAQKFVSMCEFGRTRLPVWMQASLPKRTNDAMGSILLDNFSEIASGPSKVDPGRGSTPHLLIMDEFGAFPDPDSSWRSAIPGAALGRTIVLGNPDHNESKLHKEYRKAKKGQSRFVSVFVPWWAAGYRTQSWFEDITAGWSESDIAKEYPADDETCWLKAGDPVFNQTDLANLEVLMSKPPLFDADFRGGTLTTFEAYDSTQLYLISGDVASGGGRDFTVFQIFSITRQKHVAKWKGRVSPDVAASVMAELGYSWCPPQQTEGETPGAELAPEVNGAFGKALMKNLVDASYPAIYMRYEEFDNYRSRGNPKRGWYTSAETKIMIKDGFWRKLKSGLVTTCDSGLFEEAKGFRHLPQGEMGGTPDDELMAYMIGCHVISEYRKPEEEVIDPRDTVHFDMLKGMFGSDAEAELAYEDYFGIRQTTRQRKGRWG